MAAVTDMGMKIRVGIQTHKEDLITMGMHSQIIRLPILILIIVILNKTTTESIMQAVSLTIAIIPTILRKSIITAEIMTQMIIA